MRPIENKKQHPEIAVVPTVEGMIAGAVVGAIAGPPGIAVGATLGGIVGAIAGETLEAAADESELRDEELDEQIGVVTGDIGAHDVAAAALTKLNETRRTQTELLGEHQAIERDLDAFRDAIGGVDMRGLVARFARFEDRLRAHLRYEEGELIPALAKDEPREAATLLAEHEQLRKRLDDLAIAIELHTATASDLDALFDALTAHGRNEERIFHLWGDR